MMRHPVAWSINTTAARRRHLRGDVATSYRRGPGGRLHAAQYALRWPRPTAAGRNRVAGLPGRAMKNVPGLTPWLLPLPALAGDGRWPCRSASPGMGPDAQAPARRTRTSLSSASRPATSATGANEGPMKAVVVRGNSRMALIAGLPGTGATWLSTADSPLSLDGRRCVDTRSGRQRLRHRCRTPAGAPSHPPSMPAASSGVAHFPRQETS